jgi:hypothetical protein
MERYSYHISDAFVMPFLSFGFPPEELTQP